MIFLINCMSREHFCAREPVLCVQNAVLCVQGAVLCVQGAVLCVRGRSPGEIEELRGANTPPSRGLQGGEGEGSPPRGGRRSEAQGVAGEAQRHRAGFLHAMRPEASADFAEGVLAPWSGWNALKKRLFFYCFLGWRGVFLEK